MSKVGELVTPTGVLVMDAETMAAKHDEWLEARRWGRAGKEGSASRDPRRYRIGSSDVPSILDLPGVGTPVEVWRNKVQGVQKKVIERMNWGHLFEPVIAQEWCRRNRTVIDEIGLVALKDRPWHQSTIDRRVRECPHPRRAGLRDGCGLEVKNVGYSSAERWGKDWPDRITAQLAHQRAVTGYDHIHVAANVGGNHMIQGVFGLKAEDQEIQDYVMDYVDRWRETYLLPEVEPPWSELKPDKMLEMDKASHPIRVGEATVQEIGLVMEYAQAQAEESAAGKRKKAAKVEMARVADGASLVLFGDNPAWSYREGQTRDVNLEKLAERYPDAFADEEVVIHKKTYTLVVDKAYRVKL